MATTQLERARLSRAKAAYTTRRVDRGRMATLVDDRAPAAGDLVLARAVKLGQHDKVEQPDGRIAQLFPGDELLVCYGHRYAPDQFEAEIPPDLGPCNLVAAGGVAARALAAHPKMKDATAIEPIGLVGDAGGRVLNARDGALPPLAAPSGANGAPRPRVFAAVGSSMNAGKTTSAAYLVRGLTRAGLRVGAAKVTGTGNGKDAGLMRDAGAVRVYDFTDAGHATTYLLPTAACWETVRLLTAHLAAADVDAIVLEVADGLYQRETAALLAHPRFRAAVDGFLFAAVDAMGGVAGVRALQEQGLPVAALSGVVTAAPLALREAEAAVVALGVPVLGLAGLADPEVVGGWVPAGVIEGRAGRAAALPTDPIYPPVYGPGLQPAANGRAFA